MGKSPDLTEILKPVFTGIDHLNLAVPENSIHNDYFRSKKWVIKPTTIASEQFEGSCLFYLI